MDANLIILEEMGVLERGDSIVTGWAHREQRHTLFTHNPVWAYCKENLSEALGTNKRKLFMAIDPETPWDELVAHSRLGVFLGATMSPELRRYIENPSCLCLVFEPDMAVLEDFASTQKPWQLAAGQCFLFGGSFNTLKSPLSHLLPRSLFNLGFPVFYVQDGLIQAVSEYVDQLVEQLEFIYYRYNIYPVRSTLYSRSRPLRKIATGLYYDQQKHFYSNIPRYLEGVNIGRLKDRFKGATLNRIGLASRMNSQFPKRAWKVIRFSIRFLRSLPR